MRIFTILTLGTLTAMTAFGATPMRHTQAKVPVSRLTAFAKTAVSKAADVDNEVITDTPEGEETLLSRSCDGFTTEAFEATHGRILGSAVRMVTADDGTVYLNHIASEYPVDTWVKATREGNVLTISGVQAIYTEYDWDTEEEITIYVLPMKVQIDENQQGTFVATDDLTYRFNIGEDGTLTAADPELLLGVCVHSDNPDATGAGEWVWAGFGDRDIKMSPVSDTILTPPADTDFSDWVFTDEYGSTFVTVGFNGDDIYVKGLATTMPESWVKGTVSGDKVTFPSGQYLGVDNEIYYLSYFCGADSKTVTDEDGEEIREYSLADAAQFSYDKDKNVMKSINSFVVNSTADRLFPLFGFDDVTVELQQRNPDAAPEAPYDLVYNQGEYDTSIWFQIPNVDVDGNLLNINRLYYEVIIDGQVQLFTIENGDDSEESSLVPYLYTDWMDFWVEGADHTVYLYDEVKDYVAVRSVYIDVTGKEVRSAETRTYPTGVEEIFGESEIASERWYDLSGRAIPRPDKGAAIRVVTFTDGTVKAVKMML